MKKIKIKGDYSDVHGLIDCVKRRFGVLPLETIGHQSRVLYDEYEGVDMKVAFGCGLDMYIRGFVDSKVDGSLVILDEGE